MNVNNLCFKSIRDIQQFNYIVEKYQRRYRWRIEQVEKLLDDLLEFKNFQLNDLFYCLQPVVMYNANKNKSKLEYLSDLEKIEENQFQKKAIEYLQNNIWEIVDGQQRLTTISLILNYLDNHIKIEIDTKNRNQEDFGYKLDSVFKKRNSQAIATWVNSNLKDEIQKKQFVQFIMDRVKVIWYEINEDPDVVYKRLNTGKIPLTDSELIKAFLLCSNHKNNDRDDIEIIQTEIATGWNNIEYKLQDDSFFFFLFTPENENNSRMDAMCRIIYDYDLLRKEEGDTPKYSSYPVFNYIHDQKKTGIKALKRDVWDDTILELFNTFLEWYNDVELYHYIGYLIAIKKFNIGELYKNWITQESKSSFLNSLKKEIYDSLKNRVDESRKEKRSCRDILLFHNIQTSIQLNKTGSVQDSMDTFSYRFPFDVFKKEQWDVEHIEPETQCDFSRPEDQDSYIKCFRTVSDNEPNFHETNDSDNNKNISFEDFLKEHPYQVELDEDAKNSLKNYVLLDSKTNRSYKNAIFPVKRSIIAKKDMGTAERGKSSAFIPPCTKNVFMKYYSSIYINPTVWTKEDANNYLKDIERMVEMINPEKKEQMNNE